MFAALFEIKCKKGNPFLKPEYSWGNISPEVMSAGSAGDNPVSQSFAGILT